VQYSKDSDSLAPQVNAYIKLPEVLCHRDTPTILQDVFFEAFEKAYAKSVQFEDKGEVNRLYPLGNCRSGGFSVKSPKYSAYASDAVAEAIRVVDKAWKDGNLKQLCDEERSLNLELEQTEFTCRSDSTRLYQDRMQDIRSRLNQEESK
jgi:hypothetical protein